MPTSITVGDGHGTPDYATDQLAWDALSGSDQGGTVTAECLGDCGSTFNCSGAALNDWIFQTQGIQYDGTNETSLSVHNRVTKSATTQVTFQDVLITTVNNFVVALVISGNNTLIQRYRLIAGTSAAGRSITTAQPNTFLKNGVESGGIDNTAIGFADGCNENNIVTFGASDKGYEGAGSVGVHFITDCFSFGNTNADIEASVFTVATSATEDVSGASNTGYTSAELVNFAGNDFRTKSSSALATLGGGGSFIGAFLEAGGDTITPDPIVSAQTISSPTLTQHSIFSVDNVISAQTISEPTLTQSSTLVVGDLLTSQTLSQPSLTVSGSLSVNDINNAQSISNVTLVSGDQLIVQDVLSSQTISGTSFIQHNVLLVDPITNSQFISVVSLSGDGQDIGTITVAYKADEIGVKYSTATFTVKFKE